MEKYEQKNLLEYTESRVQNKNLFRVGVGTSKLVEGFYQV